MRSKKCKNILYVITGNQKPEVLDSPKVPALKAGNSSVFSFDFVLIFILALGFWITWNDSQNSFDLGRVAPQASQTVLVVELTSVHLSQATPPPPSSSPPGAGAGGVLSLLVLAGSTLRTSCVGWKCLDLLHISQMLFDCLLWKVQVLHSHSSALLCCWL